ncbi:ribonuclease H1 [Diachasma alloeum]|uniref:ribonuclease H1 n=1 Tax=Diachasma alloeum TaxID=454923 RepID=UPI0007382CAA|nr:ribonuclease H1 [Diachasma alloeum]
MPFYAVAEGHAPGIYRHWDECASQVSGYSEADFRKFHCHADARYYLRRRGLASYEYEDPWGVHSEDEEEEDTTYYAVSVGRTPGIYTSLSQCKRQVDGCSDAEYRKFHCQTDAKRFMARRGVKNYGNGSDKSNMKFNYDKQGRVKIYVDGACSKNGDSDATAGLGVWFRDDHPLNVSKPILGKNLTNIIAETMAVTEACKIAKKNNLQKITIYTDSKYVTDVVLEHIDKWIAKGWKNSAGRKVGNKKVLEELDRAMGGLDIEFDDVEAHAGVYGNEKADHLARQAAGEF